MTPCTSIGRHREQVKRWWRWWLQLNLQAQTHTIWLSTRVEARHRKPWRGLAWSAVCFTFFFHSWVLQTQLTSFTNQIKPVPPQKQCSCSSCSRRPNIYSSAVYYPADTVTPRAAETFRISQPFPNFYFRSSELIWNPNRSRFLSRNEHVNSRWNVSGWLWGSRSCTVHKHAAKTVYNQ